MTIGNRINDIIAGELLAITIVAGNLELSTKNKIKTQKNEMCKPKINFIKLPLFRFSLFNKIIYRRKIQSIGL